MDSWWQLGEGSGKSGERLKSGDNLEHNKITCPFCMETGHFETAFHAEKKKPNSSKTLNFDTLECGNCKGYVMVLWSSIEAGAGFHDYRVLPCPLRLTSYPEYWPEVVGRHWLQAQRNIQDENWDAAAIMARGALQAALRDHQAKGHNLKREIDDLASTGILPPNMKDWSDHVRELGNDSAHPNLGQDPTNPQDARDIVSFLDFLLKYLYALPHQIQQYRERQEKNA